MTDDELKALDREVKRLKRSRLRATRRVRLRSPPVFTRMRRDTNRKPSATPPWQADSEVCLYVRPSGRTRVDTLPIRETRFAER